MYRLIILYQTSHFQICKFEPKVYGIITIIPYTFDLNLFEPNRGRLLQQCRCKWQRAQAASCSHSIFASPWLFELQDCLAMNIPVDAASAAEAAMNLEIKKAKEKADADRENSLQEEVRLHHQQHRSIADM